MQWHHLCLSRVSAILFIYCTVKKELCERKQSSQPMLLDPFTPKKEDLLSILFPDMSYQGAGWLYITSHVLTNKPTNHVLTYDSVMFALSFQVVGSGPFDSWFIKPNIFTILTFLSKFAYPSKTWFSNCNTNQNYLKTSMWHANLHSQNFWFSG